jgi:hypothetical protein
MHTKTQLQKIEAKIQRIKDKLMELDEMRPGSISKQYNVCGNPNCRCKDKINPKKHGPYYQLSFVRKGKSSSQFIKKEFLQDARKQTANFKIFKKLCDDWVELALQHAKLKLEISKEKLDRTG